jgi:hypothetical protein
MWTRTTTANHDDTDEPLEENPGGYVCVCTNKLTPVTLKLEPAGLPGKLTLSATMGGDRIRIWKDAGRAVEVVLTNGCAQVAPGTLYVEGVTNSAALRDVELRLEYDENPQGQDNPLFQCEDRVRLTIIKVDLNGFSLSPTWARGNGCAEAPHRSACQASIQPAGISTITYSIQGAAHGATIDASTGVITPGVNDSGTITVRAAVALLPSCFAESNLLIRAIPVGIATTTIETPDLNYGAIYTHTATSSGGSLENVVITEIVTVAQDDFNTGWGGVSEGTITATMNVAGQFSDNIATPSAFIDANDFLPSPPKAGLPATLNTPQILEWRCPLDNDWIPFANIAITATLSRQGANLIFTTTDNDVSCVEPYSGSPVP